MKQSNGLMHVLMVVPWDEKVGGVTSVVKHLAEHLVNEGHSVTFFHPSENALPKTTTTQLGFPGITMQLPERPANGWTLGALIDLLIRMPLVVFRLTRVLRERRIDVVNVHFVIGPFVYFAVCKRLARIRLVTSIHGVDFFPDGQPRASMGASVRYLLRHSDLIVAPSRAFLAQFLALGPPIGGKTCAIHNGIDLATFTPGPGPAHDTPRIVLTLAQ